MFGSSNTQLSLKMRCALLPTAYVVRGEGYVLTRVCLSICPHLGGGGEGVPWPGPGRRGYPSQVQYGVIPARSSQGGYPCQGVPLLGEYPCWGVPISGTPCQTWPRYPTSGTPCQIWLGIPLSGGTPPWVPSPHQTWQGRVPLLGGTPP